MVWVIGIIFALVGIVLFLGRGKWLIAGYNVATEEEKKKYDEKKLCRTIGIMLLVIAIMTFILAIVNTLNFAIVYGIVVCVDIVVGLIFASVFCKRK